MLMKKALLIGINNYPQGNQLMGCLEDINCVEEVLARNGDNSINFNVKTMPDIQNSREGMAAIKSLFHGMENALSSISQDMDTLTTSEVK